MATTELASIYMLYSNIGDEKHKPTEKMVTRGYIENKDKVVFPMFPGPKLTNGPSHTIDGGKQNAQTTVKYYALPTTGVHILHLVLKFVEFNHLLSELGWDGHEAKLLKSKTITNSIMLSSNPTHWISSPMMGNASVGHLSQRLRNRSIPSRSRYVRRRKRSTIMQTAPVRCSANSSVPTNPRVVSETPVWTIAPSEAEDVRLVLLGLLEFEAAVLLGLLEFEAVHSSSLQKGSDRGPLIRARTAATLDCTPSESVASCFLHQSLFSFSTIL